MKPPAVLLDRDGVLNEDQPEGVRSWEEFRFLPGVLDALRALARAGIPVDVITNQANVGRGRVPRAVVDGIHERARAAVAAAGGAIRSIHACYHAPEDGCACRKPEPGLILACAREHGLDLSRVPFVGDDARDLTAAARAGAIPVLVRTGKGRSIEPRARELGARETFDDLEAFVRALLSEESTGR